jgi:hypothetical protein
MGRPRTPTKVLDARGSFKKDPQRKREGEPEVKDPIGAAPEDFNDEQREAWNEIVTTAPIGVLTAADGVAVELASKLLADSRTNWDKFPSSMLTRLQSMLGQFGMNPSERSRLNIGKPKDANPFDDLIR